MDFYRVMCSMYVVMTFVIVVGGHTAYVLAVWNNQADDEGKGFSEVKVLSAQILDLSHGGWAII